MLNREEILYQIEQYNEWPEEILGIEFINVVEKVLTKKERIILEMKVEGYPNKEICRLMKKMSTDRLYKTISSIKDKLRNEMSTRSYVDEWARKEKWRRDPR